MKEKSTEKMSSAEEILSVFAALLLVVAGCGAPATSRKAPDSEPAEKSAQASKTVERKTKCETDPARFGAAVMEAAKTDTAEILLSKFGMSENQFHRFFISHTDGASKKQEDLLKNSQLDDLSSEQQQVAECNGTHPKLIRIEPENPMGFEVHFEMLCTDGTARRWKVKAAAFEACLYLGMID